MRVFPLVSCSYLSLARIGPLLLTPYGKTEEVRRSPIWIANADGQPPTEHRASEGVRQWRDKAGLSADLRLQDARGTAATRLLNAGLTLGEIASFMGWSVRHAAAVIEHYARVSPDESDTVLAKLALAKGGRA